MPALNSHADSLHILDTTGTTETGSPKAIGTPAGISHSNPVGINGVGVGRLRASGTNGDVLQWQAPGSLTFGSKVNLTSGAELVLEDGEDPDKYIRAQPYTGFTYPDGDESRVFIEDQYNDVGGGDVTAAQATAGNQITFTLELKNVSNIIASHIRFWLDASVANYEISDDGAVWVTPTTEATGIAFSDLLPNASHTLHFRRTIPALSASDPAVLVIFFVSGDVL